MIRVRLASLTAHVGALIALVAASPAWACVPAGSGSGTLAVSPTKAQPGQEVAVSGLTTGSGPVVIRVNATDGPGLASLVPPRSGKGVEFSGTFTLPADTRPGESVVVASQDGRVWRTTIAVEAADGRPLPPAPPAPPVPRKSKSLNMPVLLAAVTATVIAVVGLFVRRRGKRQHASHDEEGLGSGKGEGADRPVPHANSPF